MCFIRVTVTRSGGAFVPVKETVQFGWAISREKSKEPTDFHSLATRQHFKSSRKNRPDGRGSLPSNAFHAKNWRNYLLVKILRKNLSFLPFGGDREMPLVGAFFPWEGARVPFRKRVSLHAAQVAWLQAICPLVTAWQAEGHALKRCRNRFPPQVISLPDG